MVMDTFSELSLSPCDPPVEVEDVGPGSDEPTLPIAEDFREFSVAVAGGPSVGKTVLIRALLGLTETDRLSGAASLHPTRPGGPLLYLHPSHPGLTLWELPLEDGYPEKWISEADLLLLVTDAQFSPAHTALARSALSQGKRVCLVRSKVDCDLHTLKRRMKEGYRREEVLLSLRRVTVLPVGDLGEMEAPPLFLVSGYEPAELDIPGLRAEVEEVAREHGRPFSLAQQGYEVIGDQEIAELQSALERGGIPEVVSFIQSSLDSLLDTRIDLALVGGNPGVRHSLLNALRGLRDTEEGAAHGEDQETPTEYPSLKYPKASLWDLPGLESPNFQPQSYLERIHINRYDLTFLLVMPKQEDTSNARLLALELRKKGRKVFFIQDSEGEVDGVSQEEKDEDNEVFVLSPSHLPGPEFHRLLGSLEKELSSQKARTFMLSLPNLSAEVIRKKKEALAQEIWKVALLSSLAATMPVPGVAMACDLSVLTARLDTYRQELGLDASSLAHLAEGSGVPIATLMSEVHSPAGKGVSRKLVGKMLGSATGLGLEIAGVFLHRLPLLGPLAMGGIAFHANYAILSRCLEGMSEDAQRVLERTLTSV
ncbi:interferon-inducible GTPase 5-like isoform X1 [Ascaphus truei]|uniref:interferon-inducible GTPase 5-like isoform X1 n=2 Tax=Ascaphus truei TaxID=8439 RepID=UPI003F598342